MRVPWHELLLYAICNVPGTIAYYGTFIPLSHYIGSKRMQLQVWASLASIIGFLVNFPFFRYVVFGFTTLDGIGRQMIQYLPLAIVCTLLNNLLLDYFSQKWKMRWLSAQLLAGGVVVTATYVISKYQIFT